MANVLGWLQVGYIDAVGVPASTRVFVLYDDTATLATLRTQASAILAAETGLSEDGITDVKMVVNLATPVISSPVADSDSNEGLLMNWRVTGSRYPQEVWVPAHIDSLIVNGKIDLTNTELLNFEAAYTSQANISPANEFGIALTTLRDAAESVRKLKRIATKNTRSRA
jgi:hypothetical protein